MKKYNWLIFIFISLLLSACKDDDIMPVVDGGETIERPETLAWIEDVMRENYYWYNEIPDTKSLNYKADEETFFYSLLSSKDGKKINNTHYYFSYIENTGNLRSTIQEDYSYGIEFTGIKLSSTQIGVLILYIVPNSPADRAGLLRGDWILKMDNKDITTNAEFASLAGGPERKLTVANWDPTVENPVSQIVIGGLVFINDREVDLGEAEAVVDDPVYLYKTIEIGNKTVGYLLYNHFTDGIGGNDKSYDNKLREVSTEFKTKGVDEVVLDLRYNNGGLLTSAILLSAILAPEKALNERMGYLTYNNNQKQKNAYFDFNTVKLSPGVNLDLKQLYVLTSTSTASSSEVVINSLAPFMDVIVIGGKTVGKNVGSLTYPNDNDPYPYGTTPWVIHPIVSQISNSIFFTDYSGGFVPGTYNKDHQGTPVSDGIEIDEAFDIEIINGKEYGLFTKTYPLGDEDERMLKAALELIDGTRSSSITAPVSSGKAYEIVPGKSIDRKASNGVIIDIQ